VPAISEGVAVVVDGELFAGAEVARAVDETANVLGEFPLLVVEFHLAELLVEVVLKRLRSVGHVRHRVQLAVAGLLHRRTTAAMILVEMVVPILVERFETAEFEVARVVVLHRRVGVEFGLGILVHFRVLFLQFKKWVLLQFVFDLGVEIDYRKLQNFHGLDHARGEDHPLIHSRRQVHSHPHTAHRHRLRIGRSGDALAGASG